MGITRTTRIKIKIIGASILLFKMPQHLQNEKSHSITCPLNTPEVFFGGRVYTS
jgi:hypothetical protein